MVLQAIKNYLKKHADFFTQNRATFYIPQLSKESGNVLTFICVGYEGGVNSVEITLGLNANIYSSCTCSKNESNVCEHQVASLNKVTELIQQRKISNDFSEYMPNSRDTFIPIQNGIIDKAALKEIQFSKGSYYYTPHELLSISRTQVKYKFYDIQGIMNISLNYDKKNDELLAKCTCKATNPCHHKSKVLEDFLDKFGHHYFSPNFYETIKAAFMEDKNLPKDLNFDDLFTLTVDLKGIKYNSKISNLISANKSPLAFLDLEELEEIKLPKKAETYGVAWCFEFYRNEIFSVFPFVGKMNKDGTELSTKFVEVNSENVFDLKNKLNTPRDAEFLVAAMENQVDLGYTDWKRWNKATYDKLFASFAPFITKFGKEYPMYYHNHRDSLVKKNITPLILVQERVKPIALIKETEKFFNIQMKVRLNGQSYGIQSNKLKITPFGILLDQLFYPFTDAETALVFVRALKFQEMNVIKSPDLAFRTKFIDPLSKYFEIELEHLKLKKRGVEKMDFEKQVYLSDEGTEYIVLRPLVKYGERLLTPISEEKLWTEKNGLEYQERDLQEEQAFLDFIRNLHPEFSGMGSYFYLPADRALEKLWLMDAIEQLNKENIHVFGLNTLKKIPYNLNKPTFSTMLSSNTDWFDMKIDVKFGDQKADLRDLQKALIKKQNYVQLKDGTLGLLPQEWIEKYKKYFKLGQVKKDQLEISNYQFSLIDELFEEMNHAPQFLQELYEKKKRLANLKQMQNVPKPRNLKASLRTYQQEGLNWMVFLDENRLGGCLADDMGLGKTLQTIAFLQHLKNNNPKTQLTNLVVAPTSLMFNWKAELQKFAPKLSVLVYSGANREELKEQIMQHDVVLTTYGSLINDITMHQKNEYHYAILDESQAIKNPESRRYKAVRLLKSKNRLVLTGTPIENNTFDLYSQFNFLNPGFFGSVKHFRTTFSDAIDKDQDQETSILLAKMVNPFLLRRTKAEVATELPPKTEGFVYCEMGAEQRKVYEYYKQYFRDQIQKQIEEEGINKSQMYILQGLTKLRQICNSTELADAEKDYGSYSAKLDELTRHLKEKVSKHKVLIFSQFVGMLQIIQRRLEEENIRFEYLDGQTRKREEKVNNFQSDDSIRVFLISLKAGGTGLNLTEADYVYLVDPWWNPAVENQAIDRCYRIGQNKNVMAYRMICTDTIEEKIVQLQEKKKTVASEVIRTDLDKKSFNLKEVEHLFA